MGFYNIDPDIFAFLLEGKINDSNDREKSVKKNIDYQQSTLSQTKPLKSSLSYLNYICWLLHEINVSTLHLDQNPRTNS